MNRKELIEEITRNTGIDATLLHSLTDSELKDIYKDRVAKRGML